MFGFAVSKHTCVWGKAKIGVIDDDADDPLFLEPEQRISTDLDLWEPVHVSRYTSICCSKKMWLGGRKERAIVGLSLISSSHQEDAQLYSITKIGKSVSLSSVPPSRLTRSCSWEMFNCCGWQPWTEIKVCVGGKTLANRCCLPTAI